MLDLRIFWPWKIKLIKLLQHEFLKLRSAFGGTWLEVRWSLWSDVCLIIKAFLFLFFFHTLWFYWPKMALSVVHITAKMGYCIKKKLQFFILQNISRIIILCSSERKFYNYWKEQEKIDCCHSSSTETFIFRLDTWNYFIIIIVFW